jgi:hypothetical protein
MLDNKILCMNQIGNCICFEYRGEKALEARASLLAAQAMGACFAAVLAVGL